jgi:S1-C subfamily serine protease
MTAIDWMIVAFTIVMAGYGYLQGFIIGILSLIGFGLGAFIGTRVGPLLLPSGAHSQYAPLFGLVGALLAGGILATGFEGVGALARGVLRFPGARLADEVLGAMLTACVGLGVCWIVGAIALESAGSLSLRRDIQRSVILKALNSILPPSGPILNALARFDPLPSVNGPSADVPAPTRGIVATAGVRGARDSVVRVIGTACGLGVEGSGWVAAPGVIVTNAHVVAGESDTAVEIRGTGPNLPAQALLFDPHDDIAVLRVPGLHEPVLPIRSNPPVGTSVGILGYPEDGPFRARPGRIGQTSSVSTEDAYGNGPVTRSITALRGLIQPGNSGGPLVDAQGRVLATVFAAIVGGSPYSGGLASPNDIVRRELHDALKRDRAVGTGQCAA